MKKVVIQAGHINAKNNSIVALRGSTGAPGEQELTKRIADRLSSLLREKGVEVKQTDACANDDKSITGADWDLFLALHGDADYAGDGGSGFATFPEPSTDGATSESQRIAKIINDYYFPEVQIVHRDLANKNTKYYYMWKYLTAKTPCVLVEMGQVQDPHDKVLLANTDLIANALATAILRALGIENMPSDDTTVEDIAKLQKEIADLKKSQKDLAKLVEELRLSIEEKDKTLADSTKEVKVLKAENKKLTADLGYYQPYKSRYEEVLKKTIDKYSGWELIKMGIKKLTNKS
jgi:hypothetical protein